MKPDGEVKLSKPRSTSPPPLHAKPPMRWTGVLFAFAANTLLVTLMDALVRTLQLSAAFESLATLAAPLLAGVLTAIYVGKRGGIHAFIGGMASIPVLTFFTFGLWPPAVLAGAFCGMSGAVAEALTRGRAAKGK